MSKPLSLPDSVVVHPLVLLSVVDHYNRVAKDTKRRVVGIVLGESSKGRVDATNCYAVPFEEDDKDPSIWFLDHSYLENMFRMFKKVNGTFNNGICVVICSRLATNLNPPPWLQLEKKSLVGTTRAHVYVDQICSFMTL